MADFETTVHGKKKMDLLQALNELRRINRYAPGIQEQRQGITGPSRDWIEQQPLEGFTPEEFQMMQSPTSDMQGVPSMLPTEEQPSRPVMGPGQEYQSSRNILQPQNTGPVSRETPDQAKMLLDSIYKQSDADSEAKKAGELRHLLASVLGGAQAKYDLGGGISAGGDTPSSLQRQKEMYDWAKRPEEQAKAEQEKKRQMLDDLMKYDNLKSQQQQRQILGDKQLQETKMNALKMDDLKASITSGSEKSINELKHSVSAMEGMQQMLETAAQKDPAGKSKVPVYEVAAKQLAEIKAALPGMPYNQQKEALDRADKILAKAQGFDKTGQSAANYESLEAYRKAMSDAAGIKAGVAKTKAEKQDVHLTKPQEKLTKEINQLNMNVQRMDELEDLKRDVDTGPIADKVISPLKNAFNMDNKKRNDLKALNAQLFNPITKEFAGVSVSAGEWERLKPMMPLPGDNDEEYSDKLRRAKIEAKRMLGERVKEYQMSGGRPIDTSEVASQSQGLKGDILQGKNLQQSINKNFPNTAIKDDPLVQKAMKALNDPNAPPAAKEAALKKLKRLGVM